MFAPRLRSNSWAGSCRALLPSFLVLGTLLGSACVQKVVRPDTSSAATDPRTAPRTLPSPEYVAGPQPSSLEIPVDEDDAVWGSPGAPVTIVNFTDLECPYCVRAASTLEALKRSYGPDRLRIVIKHHPLAFHENARRAAEIAQAVRDVGGSALAFAFVSRLYQAQAELANAPYAEWIEKLGLDSAMVLERAARPEVARAVDRDISLALKLGATGTPAFRVNGRELSGAQPIQRFSELIDAELSAVQKLAAEGAPVSVRYDARVSANLANRVVAQSEESGATEDSVVYNVPIAGAPTIGPANALVTLVAFFDYECPFSKQVKGTLDTLLAEYGASLRLVVRQNPLSFHARAFPAARLALEARAQRGEAAFFDVSDRLLRSPGLEEEDLLRIAREVKLDERRVRAALTTARHDSAIQADQRLAARLRASGTPHFFANGVRMAGAQPLPAFKALIEDRLEVARSLIHSGAPNLDVYAEIMKVATEAEAPERVEVARVASDAPSRGPVGAKIVIEYFTDLQCPFCARGEHTLAELERRYPGKLRIVFRHLPLPFHESARPAARVALRARQLGGDKGFWRVVHSFYKDQQAPDAFSDQRIRAYAADAGVPAEDLLVASRDSGFDSAIDFDVQAAEAAGIRGTPSFLINGYLIRGAQPLPAFENVIEYVERNPPAR